MGSISISISLDQGQNGGPLNVRVFSDIMPGMAIPLPAGSGQTSFLVVSEDAYTGNYQAQTNDLPSGPIAMRAPQIQQDPASEALSLSLPGLWAHDASQSTPVLTCRWQRNGTDIAGATGAQYTPGPEDNGQTLQMVETATDENGVRSQTSNTVVVAALPVDLFEVMLASDGTLQIEGNDGRSFTLEDPRNNHDGTYSVAPAALAAGPVDLMAPQLAPLTVAEAGASLAITPALFAYDMARGPVSVSYTTTGANAVDASNPAAPRLLIDAADAEAGLTVTATVRQGGVTVRQTSNTVVVAALPVDLFEVMLASDGTLQIEGNDGRSFTLEDPRNNHDGTYSVAPAALAAGPVDLMAPQLAPLTVAEAGASLAITPALFAYDMARGPVSVSYTTTGANAVDASNPAAPRLLIDAADAEAGLTVTATVRQGGVTVRQTSNTVVVAALPVDLFEVMLASDGTLQIEGNDGRSFTLEDPRNNHDGTYSVAPAALAAGPVDLMAPQLAPLTVAEAGASLAITPALFAYDMARGPVSVSYTTTGANAVDASNPAAPRLLIDAADAEAGLTVTATVRQGGVTVRQTSNTVVVAALPVDLFEVMLASDGTLQIEGNDGRSFTLEDSLGLHSGTYSIPVGSLASGPVELATTVLSGDGSASVGETLSIVPALFAHDSAGGAVTISYTTTGANAVNVSDPDNPTLLLAGADAGNTVTVTATATQGVNTTHSRSIGVAVGAGSSAPILITNSSFNQNIFTTSTTVPVTMDLSGLRAGDKFYLWYGDRCTVGDLAGLRVDGGALISPILSTDTTPGMVSRGHLFEYTMPGAGSATATIQINLNRDISTHIFSAWGVRGGALVDSSVARMVNDGGSGAGFDTVTVTPTNATNLVVASACGDSRPFGTHSWDGVTEYGSSARGSGASATNVPVSAYDVEFIEDSVASGSTNDHCLILTVFEVA